MRLYYKVSRILLILLITGHAVATPVLVQKKPRAGNNVAHIPEDVTSGLRQRGNKLKELLEVLSKNAKPVGSSAARPSSSSPLSRPANKLTVVKQPLPSIPEESPLEFSQSHAPPGPGSLTESQYEPMDWEVPHGPSIESDHEMVDAPTKSDLEMVDASVLPSQSSASPIETDLEMVDVPPSRGRKKTYKSQKSVTLINFFI